jgi:hypothetical protein
VTTVGRLLWSTETVRQASLAGGKLVVDAELVSKPLQKE